MLITSLGGRQVTFGKMSRKLNWGSRVLWKGERRIKRLRLNFLKKGFCILMLHVSDRPT